MAFGNPYLLSPNLALATSVGNDSGCYPFYASSSHTDTILASRADGSVHKLSGSMNQYTFNLAMTPNDGLSLPSDW